MIDLKSQLNSSQWTAVNTINGPLLVIAGAGSGKTRVIEYRVLNLVQNDINPSSILLLTFTRRAAHEMLSRAASHDSRCSTVEGGTFHSFGYNTLRKYAKETGISNSFTVIDTGDSEEAIHRCCANLGFLERDKRFPKKGTLQSIISASVNKNLSITDSLGRGYPHFLEYASDIESIGKEYAKYKLSKDYMDYDDLLVYLKKLLENKDMRERISERFKFIMVDEYQDTNKLQGDIAYLLAERHKNVMAVGDDAQSIYGFRGATHENIMDFPKRFQGCKIIKLEENYRSTQPILNVANSVLGNMRNKYSKCLVSVKKHTGDKPQLLFFKNASEESEWVVSKIIDLVAGGTHINRIGVLFRSGYISIPIQAELSRRKIPYQVFGGFKFYELAHVKDLMAHLKVIANPKDELAWHRALTLIEGIGPKTSDTIIKEILSHSSFNDKYTKGHKFSSALEKLKSVLNIASEENISVEDKFEVILDYYKPLLTNKFDDWHLRRNDLDTLRTVSAKYDSISDLLSDFAIDPPDRNMRIDTLAPETEKPLTLSTIHSAKGLEWDAVFFIGIIDGVLPVSFSFNSPDADAVEEEHRLFYVGVTRAKNHLFLLSHMESNGRNKEYFNRVSRFVDSPSVISKLKVRDVS
ncbi:MAG: ATP-dependent helicase [Candidatus Omnitrophica bacterium]|nr:ATP-dependent helicase [Candidatus Omnitrophota bacterium]